MGERERVRETHTHRKLKRKKSIDIDDYAHVKLKRSKKQIDCLYSVRIWNLLNGREFMLDQFYRIAHIAS